VLLNSCFKALELAFFCLSVSGRFNGSEDWSESCAGAVALPLVEDWAEAAGACAEVALAVLTEGAAEVWAAANADEKIRPNEMDHRTARNFMSGKPLLRRTPHLVKIVCSGQYERKVIGMKLLSPVT